MSKRDKVEKIQCPYCGAEMRLSINDEPREVCYICTNSECFSRSPSQPGAGAATAAALCRYKPVQKPLTEDELKEMPLFSWVWIEILKPSAFERFAFDKCKSAYYRKQYDFTGGQMFCCGYPGMGYAYDYCDYGETWVALRHEPTDAERAAAKWEDESDA